MDVVCDDHAAGVQPWRQQLQHGQVEVLPAVQEDQVHGLGHVPQCLQRVTETHFGPGFEPGLLQIRRGDGLLRRLDLAADHQSGAVVPDSGCQVDRGDAERSAELDHVARTQGAGGQVEELATFPGNGNVELLHCFRSDDLHEGLAPHPARQHARRQTEELQPVTPGSGVQPLEHRAQRLRLKGTLGFGHGCLL
jgi:hypothetical protein